MSRAALPKPQEHQEGRRLLLRAALRVFQREGLDGGTVEMICREAGYSKGGFYFHFPGKEALIDELLDQSSIGATDSSHAFSLGTRSLLPQLWAEARRTAVREWLAEYYSRRLVQMRRRTTRLARKHAPNVLAHLTLALETGLQVQWQVMTSPSERRQVRRALEGLMPEQPPITAA
jgi:hypothetical protein